MADSAINRTLEAAAGGAPAEKDADAPEASTELPEESAEVSSEKAEEQEQEQEIEESTQQGPSETLLEEPWNLVRVAMGSLAGESWRLKQAVQRPTEAFELRDLPKGETPFEAFRATQSYEDFRRKAPFRPNSTNDTIDVVVVGEHEKLRESLLLDRVLRHLEAFVGFKVVLRTEPLTIGPWARQRQSSDGYEQLGAHLVLAQLRNIANPLSVCTVGITVNDLYPPSTYEYVTGIADSAHRVAVYSLARYFSTSNLRKDATRLSELRQHLSLCMVKSLCREILRLCAVGECRLVQCLMNPYPPGIPEAITGSPLNLCCICLRKLQWLAQTDLLDRYANLQAVLSSWFANETVWICKRMVQIGMPTYTSLRDANPLRDTL